MPLTAMTDKKIEIRDDEFRVIGKPGVTTDPESGRRSLVWIILAIAAAIGILLVVFWPKTKVESQETAVSATQFDLEPLGVTTDRIFTERIDTLVGTVQLAIYLPHNATPVLTADVPSGSDIILAARAADVRADNGKINEAFVCEGKALAFGMSKKGYCAILGGEVTIGVAADSPLFEEAVESGGYFFRQYPLVDNGTLVENEPKNKTMRRAICSRAGQIFIAVSETDESFHDFAQALVEFGVENAIYLTGGHESGGWWVGPDGTSRPFDPKARTGIYENETYILWK